MPRSNSYRPDGLSQATHTDLAKQLRLQRRLSRRTALRGALTVVSGTGALLLFGCSSANNKPAASQPSSAARPGTAAPQSSAAPISASPAAAKPKVGGSLSIVVTGLDGMSLDPHTGTGGGDQRGFWPLYDQLVNYNRRGELDPTISLAQQWEVPEPTRITFTLRSGIKFHDGTDFNAAAVKFNIDRINDPNTKSTVRDVTSVIDHMDVIDDTHISFVLKRPDASLLTSLGDRAGAIVSPAAVAKYNDLLRNPVGTGPFKFKEITLDHMTYVKNPDYWGKDANGITFPYLDQLLWQVVPDPGVQVANLESGTSDIVILPITDAKRIGSDSRFTVQRFNGAQWSGAYVNKVIAPVNDLHLRRAIARAIDKKAVTQAVTGGDAPVAVGPLTVASWAYNPNLKALDFDLAEAKKELAASSNPNGTKVEVGTSGAGQAEQAQMAVLMQQMLKAINLDVTVTDAGVDFTNRMFMAANLHMGASTWSARVDPDGTVASNLRSTGFTNAGHPPNQQLDDLIDQARAEYDVSKRKALYDQIQQIGIDQVYEMYVYYTVLYAAAPKKVQNMNAIWGAEGKERYKELWLV